MSKSPIRAADAAAIVEAAGLLAAGRLVAFPTETVYGLGADATNGEAVAGIYAAKERPSFNPLIAHVADLTAAQGLGRFNPDALALARAFWPGPLTLVTPVLPDCAVSSLARAGLDSLGIRVPDHPVALALLRAFGRPVAAPSANRSGRVSPTTAVHVAEDLGERVGMILDGGATQVGVESTIVSCLEGEPRILRPGGIARDEIERVLGRALAQLHGDPETLLAPGMMASHYAPRARVRLNARQAQPGEAVLDFGAPMRASDEAPRRNLSQSASLTEAAANLFADLRALDETGVSGIAVAPVPMQGLGEAINDRLTRAAAPR